MFYQSLKKLKDAIFSTLPVIAVVLVLFFAYFPFIKQTGSTGQFLQFNTTELWVFIISAVCVVVGMWLFNIGSESSMSKMGELVGSSLTKKRSVVILIIIAFLFGLLITVAEPDLAVLAAQVPMIPSSVFIISVGIGVGIFMVIGAFRILLGKSLKFWLLACYGLLFTIACLVDKTLLPLCFDSGGVTTGPITVPFILALGAGLASSRASRSKDSDSFGLVAFCSIGPILTVMILSIYVKTSGQSLIYNFSESVIKDFGSPFIDALLPSETRFGAILDVLISLIPIFVFFLIYELIFIRLPGRMIAKMLAGIGVAYVGLVLFMMAVNAGFMPIGQKIGMALGYDKVNGTWLLLLVGAFLGIAAVFAEPAVHVLTSQIETISEGTVHKNKVLIALALGNGLALVLSMLRIIFPDIQLMFVLIPGYIVAFLLSFIVPDIYTAIAFDSGGVVSGPMNTTFILPFAIGACVTMLGQDYVLTNAFGTVAIVALMPLISIQLIGLAVGIKKKYLDYLARNRVREEFDDQIIHF